MKILINQDTCETSLQAFHLWQAQERIDDCPLHLGIGGGKIEDEAVQCLRLCRRNFLICWSRFSRFLSPTRLLTEP